ncbi:acyltransferase family protein [Kordiimonas sediminis]|uniref:acyltransferase family protein n=1 Tax=Kordiimonas sediminis TaxID=1735581 RepID=UPI00357156EC
MLTAKLSDVCEGRDNNLNLIRMILATSVIVSHSYPIALGSGVDEPLEAYLGFSLGKLAVYGFFILSGFLVAQSYVKRNDPIDFSAARIFRIFPGLIVVILLTAFLLAPMLTSLSMSEHFSSMETYSYVIRNISLIKLQFSIPGLFEENIYGSAINGSLWTLPHELACYVLLLIAGIIGFFRSNLIFWLIILTYVSLYLLFSPHFLALSNISQITNLADLSFAFLVGVMFCKFQRHIFLSPAHIVVLLLVTILLHDTYFFVPVFLLFYAVLLFWLGYIPSGFIRKYNNVGDYSYGTYIYAFPVQQILSYYGMNNPDSMTLLTFLIVLPLAILSWHIVEKPSLRLRSVASSKFKEKYLST